MNESITNNIDYYQNDIVNNWLTNLFSYSASKNVSDIHIEPLIIEYRIRLRIDGILQEYIKINIELAKRVISRLKILANLNIAETRLPQDGNFSIINKTLAKKNKSYLIDIRISTVNTINGEKATLRIHYPNSNLYSLASIGLIASQQAIVKQAIAKPSGLILITGPTGSGKTSTLYAILNALNADNKNIITIEDPVEIKIPSVNQCNVNTALGLTFNNLLRINLRQDPDIIMIGEIRDHATATTVIQAALTGHLVLATLHVQSIELAFSRLTNLGIPLAEFIPTCNLIINQRLIRLLCTQCKTPTNHHNPVLQAKRCHACFAGFAGRSGLFEVLPISTKSIKNTLPSKNSLQLIQHYSKLSRLSLAQSGLMKVKAGLTSLDEINRALGLSMETLHD